MRAPEVVEALRIRLKKFAQLEVGRVRAVPLQQLLELRVPGERSHGGTREVHGAGRARKKKERGVWLSLEILWHPLKCKDSL